MIDADDDLVAETVALLQNLGLTEYEAKCLVALTRIDQGTARELADVAEVPRARVYDCMDALRERGLVDVQGSQPRQYRTVGPDETVTRLRRTFADRFDRLGELLPTLSPPEPRGDGPGVWTLDGDDAVSDRLATLTDGATEDILLVVAMASLLTDELLATLSAASDRGIDITVASPSDAIRGEIRARVPDGTVTETWTWWETHPIQTGEISSILLVDGRDLLVSSVLEAELPNVDRHAAVWSDDANAPVVGMMRPLLASAMEA